jgi:hypothetical protein
MKELGMSWREIKNTPRHEMTGLLMALNNYERLHQFDGYSAKDVSELAKDKPQVRSDYASYMNLKRSYELRAGKRPEVEDFKNIIGK